MRRTRRRRTLVWPTSAAVITILLLAFLYPRSAANPNGDFSFRDLSFLAGSEVALEPAFLGAQSGIGGAHSGPLANEADYGAVLAGSGTTVPANPEAPPVNYETASGLTPASSDQSNRKDSDGSGSELWDVNSGISVVGLRGGAAAASPDIAFHGGAGFDGGPLTARHDAVDGRSETLETFRPGFQVSGLTALGAPDGAGNGDGPPAFAPGGPASSELPNSKGGSAGGGSDLSDTAGASAPGQRPESPGTGNAGGPSGSGYSPQPPGVADIGGPGAPSLLPPGSEITDPTSEVPGSNLIIADGQLASDSQATVPEPTSLVMLGLGVVLVTRRLRRRQHDRALK